MPESATLNFSSVSSWSAAEVVSLMNSDGTWSKKDLTLYFYCDCNGDLVDDILSLINSGVDIVNIANILNPCLSNAQKLKFIMWVTGRIVPKKETTKDIILLEFDCRDLIEKEILKTLHKTFKKSIDDWDARTKEQEDEQRGLLKDLYKVPLLPDGYHSFTSGSYNSWTGNFDEKRIPEDKGSSLREALSDNMQVGRGQDNGYTIIPFIDLSTSGKTYTVFNLAHARPKGSQFERFFVVYCVPNSKLFNSLVSSIEEEKFSAEMAVSTYALTAHLMLERLLKKYPDLKPINFLKFLRNGGDTVFSKTFNLLKTFTILKPLDIEDINTSVSNRLMKEHKIKIVFAFDEAIVLDGYAKGTVKLSNGEKGSLFHAVYKVIHVFNNPVLLGTTFSFSIVLDRISGEGRTFLNTVIGDLSAWEPRDIETMMRYRFNFNNTNTPPEFKSMCYLLSGSPEHFTSFHRILLNKCKNGSMINFNDCLLEIVEQKKAAAKSRVDSILTRTGIIDTIFQLLFRRMCNISHTDILNSDVASALIETTFAHVSKRGDKGYFFDIIDPIMFKVYFEIMFQNHRESMWKYLSENKGRKGPIFEEFIMMLLLEESYRLESSTIRKSSLFSKLPDEYDKYTLTLKSFVRDSTLSKDTAQKLLVPGAWYALFDRFFKDSFVKPDDSMGPDGVFFLEPLPDLIDPKEPILVMSAITTVSDPVSDKHQPKKAFSLYQTTDPSNIGTFKNGTTYKEEIDTDVQHMVHKFKIQEKRCLRWLVCPFLSPKPGLDYFRNDAELLKPFTEKKHDLIITVEEDISNCLDVYNTKPYHKYMENIWEHCKPKQK